MSGYVAVAWTRDTPHAASSVATIRSRLSASASHLECVADQPHLLVFAAAATGSIAVANDDGVVLGTLFEAHDDSYRRVNRLDQPRLAATSIDLLRRYWGRYVAFLRDGAASEVHAIRDPSGMLPCYFMQWRGLHVFFSDVQDCMALGLVTVSIDWDIVGALAGDLVVRSGKTFLRSIEEVRPGECIAVHNDGRERRLGWNPVDVAQTDILEEPGAAARLLRQEIQRCTAAWASCHRSIIHSLSGGLDSSIVLACLHAAPGERRITCLNYYTNASRGDERRFARQVTGRFAIGLVEHLASGADVRLATTPRISLSMTPAAYAFELLYGRYERELATQCAATAFFQGGGGDGVLFQFGAEYAPGDYVACHGLDSQVFRVAYDAARVTRLSMWSLLGKGIAALARKRRWRFPLDLSCSSAFLTPHLLAHLRNLDELLSLAWFVPDPQIPQGKRLHILAACAAPGFSRAFRDFARPGIVFPLMSQPIVELCLRMPTYTLTHGGWDRAIARRAFAQDLPRAIVKRRTKGGADDLVREICETNAAYIRECLLYGSLVRQGIVDRDNLAKYLDRGTFDGDELSVKLLSLVELQMFLDNWHGAEQALPAHYQRCTRSSAMYRPSASALTAS
jgi:asparagine synthase (glutamine-hydrolysing)